MTDLKRYYFYYEAFDEVNTYVSYIAAQNDIAAYELLRSMGLNVVELKKQNSFHQGLNQFYRRLSKEALIFFFRQLSFALNNGISLQRAISLSSIEVKNKRMSHFISHILLMLSRGFSFSESLTSAPYDLPLIVIEWIKVGETKGNLDYVLEEIALFLEKDYSLKREFKNQLTYPMIILFMIVGFLILLASYFIPMLKNAYLDFGVQLPNSLETFLKISLILGQVKYGLLILLLGLLYLILVDYKGLRGRILKKIQVLFLKVSFSSKLLQLYYFIPFIRIIGLLLKENISIATIFLILSNDRKNSLYLEELKEIYHRVLAGQSLTKAFVGVFFIPSSALQMLAIAEEGGSLPKSCLFLADYYERIYQENIRRIIKLLEPMMIILLGLIVLFLALAFYVPIISSYEQFFSV